MIKIIAILTMLIDHIGIFFFDNDYTLRLIGRISFPLFAALLAYNYFFRTSDQTKFTKRLLIFAFLSQPFYILAFGNIFKFNIFFQFILAIINFEIFKKYFINQTIKNFIVFIAIFIFSILIAQFISYRTFGFLVTFTIFIYFFMLNKNIKYKHFILPVLFLELLFLNPLKYIFAIFVSFPLIYYLPLIEKIKEPFFKKINQRYKYLFYWFYPAHLLLFVLLFIFIDAF